MGQIHADIELINAGDVELARRSLLDQDEIRRISVNALVDTGCTTMAINENIQQVLQLPVVGKKIAQLASGKVIECDVVAPLEVRFKGRSAYCSGLVLPEDSEPLLGAIPIEELNLLIHLNRQELILNPNELVPMPTLKVL
jgi:clan AA aspartic protease